MTDKVSKKYLVLEELKAIEERDGILKPEAVVDFAEDPSTALHDEFQWDDSVAACEYRLWQARHLIRAMVVVVQPEGKEITTNAFVHIEDDNEKGYHSISVVLSNEDMKTKMLSAAKREMLAFRRKYSELKELAEIFEKIDRLVAI